MKITSQKTRKSLSTERCMKLESVGKRTERVSRLMNTTRKITMTPKYMSQSPEKILKSAKSPKVKKSKQRLTTNQPKRKRTRRRSLKPDSQKPEPHIQKRVDRINLSLDDLSSTIADFATKTYDVQEILNLRISKTLID